jgi:2,4-dienoyl-CoA reductase-like NADH-dependent reductase (Old Yellow Enzyme family)/thioredoxin reductase
MFENLLRPGKINSMHMRNRLIAGPMEKSLANPDGTLNQRYIDYTRERAKGGAALIQLEAAYVSPEGRGNPFQLGCHGDHVLPGLAHVAEVIHEHDGKLGMQLHHGGRQSSSVAHHRQPIGPSVVPCSLLDPGSIPREMTKMDIHRVRDDFVRAAERCLNAGVDMIIIHGAHGYLLGQFLSPQSNLRSDDYGGTLENRARFPLEVVAAIRRIVGSDYPIGYRLSAVEYVKGGLEIEEATRFSGMLADSGIDLIDVAGAVYESIAKMFQTPEAPKGGFVAEAVEIRKAVAGRVPVSVVQRLNDPEFADGVMARDGFEYITLARAFHADPYYVRHLEEGGAKAILPCIGCNTCLNFAGLRQPTICAANPLTLFETARRPRMTKAPQQVLVVGGGVGGLHAARLLALEGQEVLLCEATNRLGGQINHCRLLLPDYGNLVDWLERELQHLGVSIELNQAIEVDDVIKRNPDAVIVATGAVGGDIWAETKYSSIPILNIFEAMERPASDWSGNVAVIGGNPGIGGDYINCFVAKTILHHGANVHLVESSAAFANDWQFNGFLMEQELKAIGKSLHLYAESTVELIEGDRITVQSRGNVQKVKVDTVVYGGRFANNGLAEALWQTKLSDRVHVIGDANRPREIYLASHEAWEVAQKIGLASGY